MLLLFDLLRESKVTQFDSPLRRHQDVAALDVSVQKVVFVQVGQALQNLLQDALELTCIPSQSEVNQARQVVRDELENQENPVAFPVLAFKAAKFARLLRVPALLLLLVYEDVLELDYVFVFEPLEDEDFAQ